MIFKFARRALPVLILFLGALSLHSQTAKDYMQDLKYGTPDIRARAIEEISRTGNTAYTLIITNALKDPEPIVRLSAVRGLLVLNNKEAVQDLINALDDPVPGVRAEIKNVLMKTADKELLHKNLKENKNTRVREQIITIFSQSKDKSSMQAIAEALNDNDFVRYSAVKALGVIGDISISNRLMDLLDDPIIEMELEAANSLAQIKAYNATPRMLEMLDSRKPIVKRDIPAILDKLIAPETFLYYVESLKKSKSSNAKKYSARALGVLGDKSAIPVLLQSLVKEKKDTELREEILKSLNILVDRTSLLNICVILDEDKDSFVREYAVSTLKKLKDPRAVPFLLVRVGREKDKVIRDEIHDTALEIADPTISEFLIKYARDKNKYSRQCAIDIIGKLELKTLLPQVLEAYKAEKKDKDLKLSMLATLNKIADKSALGLLQEKLLSEKETEMKVAIIVVLKKLADYSTINTLLECLKKGDESLTMECTELLDKISDEKSIDYYRPVISDKNLAVRTYAMKIAKKYPRQSVLPMALVAARDKDTAIRKDAVEVLGIIGDLKGVDELLQRAENDKEEEIRAEAVKSLAKIGDKSSIPHIMRILKKDKSPNVKLEAVKFLKQYGDASIIPDLVKIKDDDMNIRVEIVSIFEKLGRNKESVALLRKMSLKDPEPSVRAACVRALGVIGDEMIIEDLKKIFNNDSSSEVKDEAMKALARLKAKEMIPDFMDLVRNGEMGQAAVDSLDLLVDETDAPYLVACLRSENDKIRSYCLEKLKKFKSKNVLDDLFALLETTKSKKRKDIMDIISLTADGDYADRFIAIANNPSNNYDLELILWTIENMGRGRSDKSVDYLLLALRHPSWRIREASVNALAQIRDQRARQPIEYIAGNDNSQSVRNAASIALENVKNWK